MCGKTLLVLYGGSANIEDVDCCATRLRCTVSNADLVNDGILKATGASGVVHRGQGVQIIYGPGVTVIKANLEDYLEHAPKELYEPQKDAESTGQNISEDDKIETKAEEKKIVDTIVISSPITGLAADLSGRWRSMLRIRYQACNRIHDRVRSEPFDPCRY